MKTLILGDLCPKDGNFEYFKKLDIDTLLGIISDHKGENDLNLNLTDYISVNQDAIKKLIEESAKELMLGGVGRGAGEKRFDRTLYSMACKAAVKAGIPSTDADHRYLVEKLREIDNITVCPHGRPVALELSHHTLDKQFDRTGF